MNNRSRLPIINFSLLGIALVSVAIDVFFLVPKLQALRISIDNDRASSIVIVQQQSNLDQLTKDLESIQSKQAELEKNIWTFLKEDIFFARIDALNTKGVTVDAPAIADATPSGEILSRAVTIVIHGKLDRALATVDAIQSITPMIAIQQATVANNAESLEANDVQITLEAITLWK